MVNNYFSIKSHNNGLDKSQEKLLNKKVLTSFKKSFYLQYDAPVAELVDAHASGACWGFPVKVQVFSGAPFVMMRFFML